MTLTQKECSLLNDLKEQEQLCIDKYTKHSSCACDPQLKNLFSQIAQREQGHLNTLTQIGNGCCPQPSGGGSQQIPNFQVEYACECAEKSTDKYLCSDVLAAEKHASHLYDTCVFEFADENVRNTLNHIQKEEQQHGKMIYDYMQANGMYC